MYEDYLESVYFTQNDLIGCYCNEHQFFFIVDWNKITRYREENIKDMYDRDTGIEITIVQ